MKVIKNRVSLFVFSILSAYALIMNLDVTEAPEAGIKIGVYQQIYKLITIIAEDIADQGLLLSVLTVLFLGAYWYIWNQKGITPMKYSKALALFLAVMYAAGMAYAEQNTVKILFTSSIRLLKTIIVILGFWIIYVSAINILYYFLHEKADLKPLSGKRMGKLGECYQKHPFVFCWILIMGVWLMHLILRYPGVMSYDNARELSYYFGYAEFTTAQPVFHTVLFGFFVQIGIWLGSENLGLFLFVLMQSFVMSGILSYTLLQMKKWNISRWLRVLTMVIYTCVPYYAGYASFPIKDFLYTGFFVLLLLYSMKWEEISAKELIGWVTAGSLLILFRNNGKIVYIAIAIIILCKALKNKSKKMRGKTILILLLPLLIAEVISASITILGNVQKDTPKEMLSLPFQQTARYVRDYGEEVTEEEKEAIGRVLDYDKIAKVYMELTSDPVKTTYHADGIEDLKAYFKVWLQQFFKHPLCYIEATWNQNYYLFTPNIDNIVYNKDCTVAYEIMNEMGMQELIEFKVPEKMHGISSIMVSFYTLLHRLPIIGILSNVAFYIILLFAVTLFFVKDRKKTEVWILFPLWLTFLIIIASPQIQNQPRYAFPIIYSMPLVAAFYKKVSRK